MCSADAERDVSSGCDARFARDVWLRQVKAEYITSLCGLPQNIPASEASNITCANVANITAFFCLPRQERFLY